VTQNKAVPPPSPVTKPPLNWPPPPPAPLATEAPATEAPLAVTEAPLAVTEAPLAVTDAPNKEIIVDTLPVTYIDEGESYVEKFTAIVRETPAAATNAVFVAKVDATFESTCADVMTNKAKLNEILGDFLLANLGAGYTGKIGFVSQSCVDVSARRARRATSAVVTTSIGFTEGEGSTKDEAEAAATAVVVAATSTEPANQLIYSLSGTTSSVGAVSVEEITIAVIIADEPDRDAKIVVESANVVDITEGKAKKAKKAKKGTDAVEAVIQPSVAAKVAKTADVKGSKTNTKAAKVAPGSSKMVAGGKAEAITGMSVAGLAAGVVAAIVVAVGVMLIRAQKVAETVDSSEYAFEIVVSENDVTEQTPLVEAL